MQPQDGVVARVVPDRAVLRDRDLPQHAHRVGHGQPLDAPPLAGRRWKLVSIRISGFRGIADELPLDLDPGAGLTVVHAPNGSGKSSLSDGVRAAIWGELPDEGRELWNR